MVTEDTINNKSNISTFKLVEELTSKGLLLKNIIIWVNKFESINPLITNFYKNILFFVKSEDYFFDKDPIREKHIYKELDWGKRAKNYNPKGKDPGNVWLRTIDDSKGKITGYQPLSLSEVVNRCILCSTKERDRVLIMLKKEKIDTYGIKRQVITKNG